MYKVSTQEDTNPLLELEREFTDILQLTTIEDLNNANLEVEENRCIIRSMIVDYKTVKTEHHPVEMKIVLTDDIAICRDDKSCNKLSFTSIEESFSKIFWLTSYFIRFVK